jgi:hypothetical protein
MPRWFFLALAVMACLDLVPAAAQSQRPVAILLDTDIGSELDDALALGLAIASPQVELVGVTTCTSDAEIRARMALRMLHAAGREKVPVAFGAEPQPKSEIKGQYQYYYHPAVLYNRAGQPQKQRAVEFLYAQLKQRPGEITIVAVGPLTNIARLLDEHADAKALIKRLVVMGGSLARDYDGSEKATVSAGRRPAVDGITARRRLERQARGTGARQAVRQALAADPTAGSAPPDVRRPCNSALRSGGAGGRDR